jgi:hypothetical protein
VLVGSLFSVVALSQAVRVLGCAIRGGEGMCERRTALKRRLFSAGACSLLGAHAGAVVTSAASHLEVGVELVLIVWWS